MPTDHNVCSRKASWSQSSSQFHITMQNSVKALHQFLPDEFSNKFRTPCWYSSYHIPSWVSDIIKSSPLGPEPIFEERMASRVIQEVFGVQPNSSSKDFYCWPNVYLAGFPKCGTTALYTLIAAHPQVAEPAGKEGHFWSIFAQYGSYTHKQIQCLWYLNHFKPAAEQILESPRGITLDASASTLWRYYSHLTSDLDLSFMPFMISSVAPNTKYIVIMRNPVQRLHSDFWYFCAKNSNWRQKGKYIIPRYYVEQGEEMFHNLTVQAIKNFQSCTQMGIFIFECVRIATVGCYNSVSDCFKIRLGIGLYYYHIVPWLNNITRENFLFLRTEDLAQDPYAVMKEVWTFLELKAQTKENLMRVFQESSEWNKNSWIKSNQYKNSFSMLPETAKLLSTFYQPYNQLLAQLLSDHRYLWSG